MKLFTKISFIVAVVALGLGILGICAGMAMGADAGDLSEMGIYISPHHQMEIKKFTEDDMEDIIEEWYDYKDLDEFEHRHHGKYL